jgi:predicted dehydrogenase
LPKEISARETVRLLIIGAGKMGKAHTAAFRTIPGVEIVGIASRGGVSAAQLASELPGCQSGQDWRALVHELRPHACVVAVSHLFNETITAQVIDLGLHVLSEKPVSLSSAVISSLASKAEEKGVVAMAAMNRRYLPTVATAIDIVRFFGKVLGITALAPDPVRPFRARASYDERVYDNWLRMNTLHVIDLMRLAGGEVAWVSGDARFDQGTEEWSIVATISFDSGALGCFVSHSGAGGMWELRIHGEGVEAHLSPLERGTLRIGDATPRPLPSGKEPAGIKPGLYAQGMAFVEAIRSGGILAPPASDLNDHARTMKLAEALDDLRGQTTLRWIPPG